MEKKNNHTLHCCDGTGAFAFCDAKGNTYYNKHAGARQFLADIGCPDQNIYINDSMASKPGTDTIGVTIGSKKVNKKYVKKYKKIFTKKNAGKKVKVTL